MKSLYTVVCLTLALTISASGMADEKQKKGKGERKAPSVTARLVEKIELTDAQKEQVAAIDKQFAARLQEINKSRSAILTAEQKTAQQDAQKKAKEAGSSQADTRKTVEAALKLSPEQAEKMKEVQKTQVAMNAEVLVALKKILTPEQQAKLPQTAAGKKKADGGQARGKKKKKAE